ncbi:hypothetical protein L596_020080 [Steinernema carpocapsae]|uniref:Uncharacterized protein n=1 Tax=Steinernema carpocapsae TaxID=34508 RepID=A0A4U5MSG1_STECR|nr:hypothetical protein L596_020080 [Steinernema carpocapsae]
MLLSFSFDFVAQIIHRYSLDSTLPSRRLRITFSDRFRFEQHYAASLLYPSFYCILIPGDNRRIHVHVDDHMLDMTFAN